MASRDRRKRPVNQYLSSLILHGAIKGLAEKYSAYASNPEKSEARQAFRMLLATCKELGIPPSVARYLAEFGRCDEDAAYTFQVGIGHRAENLSRREIRKEESAQAREKTTALREQELFFRVLWHRDIADCSLDDACEAVANGTAHNVFPDAPMPRRSAATVRRAYLSMIQGYRDRGVKQIEFGPGPTEKNRKVVLRGKGRPKKDHSLQ